MQVRCFVLLLSFFAICISTTNNLATAKHIDWTKVAKKKSVGTKLSFSFEVNSRLLVDFSVESIQVLGPINELEQESVVSLEEACESLQNILGAELELYIKVAKSNSKAPKCGLTPDESASIYLYTMEWDEVQSSLCAALSQTLCSADETKLQPWLKYLKLFFTAFFKLP